MLLFVNLGGRFHTAAGVEYSRAALSWEISFWPCLGLGGTCQYEIRKAGDRCIQTENMGSDSRGRSSQC